MDPPAAAPGLRIQLPQSPAAPSSSSSVPLPPLEPPPFAPATVRKCLRSTVRIQNHDRPQEVLILTSVHSSVESILSVDPRGAQNGGEMDLDAEMDEGDNSSDFTSSSDDFSSSEESEEEYKEEEGGEDNMSHEGGSTSHEGRNGEMNGARSSSVSQPSQSYRMKAFWLSKRPLCENRHGVFTTHVYYAKVLEKADYNWTVTDEEVAVKAVSWDCIRACRNRLSEDFLKEIAALQYLSEWHERETPPGEPRKTYMDSHVLPADTIMSNETHLYIVMPYCAGGDLCQRVAEKEETRFTEDEARFWFRQILKGLETLQSMQICHRDLSPENLIILQDKSLVIDFGMCLRIPYSDAGRHLIRPRTPCGKLPHMSPELYRKLPFDGHAVDIWAAGTILLFMMTGKRLQNPPLVDRAFDSIDLGISYEATDLLRKMFRLDPKQRLSLEQIKAHPFVTYEFLCQR